MKQGIVAFLAFFLLSQPGVVDARKEKSLTWGDQGDGTYRNPILKSDFSDPDILRHGDDFYLIASDFHFVGMQVLHSRDLVNWSIIGQVFNRLAMAPKYDEMKAYSQGTWAPSLRYHNGEFYIFVCTPADGLFMWHAKNPAGPWSETVTVKAIEKWEDPCPFWDDDGQAYLVRSEVGAGPIILHRMSVDGTKLLDAGMEIYRGKVAEGPKLYKRKGYYYISLPEGGVENGWQTVLRSRNIYGPYERREVFLPGSPHQGGWVELKNGETWFASFKSSGYLGRICYLNPIRWTEDDWPVFGDNGRPVDAWNKPDVGKPYPILHPQASDEFDRKTLSPLWQWNHNPVPEAWSLAARNGWLRLTAKPAAGLDAARNTLTGKIWDSAGLIDVKMDASLMKDGQSSGFAFMSGSSFAWVGVSQENGVRKILWDDGEGPVLQGKEVWLRGVYRADIGTLRYSLDGKTYVDTGKTFRLFFRFWKGARIAIFSYGPGGGSADFDYVRYKYGTTAETLGLSGLPATATSDKIAPASTIDRKSWVTRHNPKITRLDADAPLTVGNGGFAFGVDITGLQTFADHYHRWGIPLETLARWCWHAQPNPQKFRIEDTNRNFLMPDGRELGFPTIQTSPAGEWLRQNPHIHPLGNLSLEWLKPDGSPLTPEDIQDPEQTLDLWRGVITSRFRLAGEQVWVTTVCDPVSDTLGVHVESPLVEQGKLYVRLAFPRGHDLKMKNTPGLDWSHEQAHESALIENRIPGGALIRRSIDDTRYFVAISAPANRIGSHAFRISGKGGSLEFSLQFLPDEHPLPPALPSVAQTLSKSAAYWEKFWIHGAAVDFTGSSNPLAWKLEERIVLSQYLMAVQMAGKVPPQESGLTCSTWYGKHHTEMIWWHAAHFSLWRHDELLAKSLVWYQAHLPEARKLAADRGLRGARWAKMVGPEGRESPGGNPLIVWNQPHMIYLCELLYRSRPSPETLVMYRSLVLETADCLASMAHFDAKSGVYALGPPLWIAQEIYDPATSRNPSFELSYWRWALGVAQLWRERLNLPRDKQWDDIIARLAPLPVAEGKYVALESHPDTWDNMDSRHDHPSMLMPLGFLPGGSEVDRATMTRTLDAVLENWDWETKIWGWDYPLMAMTAALLGRPDLAVQILLRDGPNNRYFSSGHCPQGSDEARPVPLQAGTRRHEIASYMPANGAFLSAVALMIAGWDGCQERYPGIPKDGTWTIRAEGLRRLP